MMGSLPMLWMMLRWNLANTLAIAAFCLLSMLSAMNDALFAGSSKADSLAGATACNRLCDRAQQLPTGERHAAPIAAALMQPQAFVVN